MLEVAFNMNPKGFIEPSAFSVSFCNFFKILSKAHYSLWFTLLLIVKSKLSSLKGLTIRNKEIQLPS